MARQYVSGGLFPAIVNEQGTLQYGTVNGVVNEQQSGGSTFTWQQNVTTEYQPRRAAALTTAVFASGCFFVGVPTSPSIGWLRPLSEPVRPAPSLARAQLVASVLGAVPIVPVVAPSMDWIRPLSEPVRAAPSLYRAHILSSVLGAVPIIPATAPAFDWYRQLNEPVRPGAAILRAALGTGITLVIPPPAPSIGWNVALSLPTRRPPALGPHNQQATARGALAPLQTDIRMGTWFRPLAEPTRRAPALPTAAIPSWTGVLRIIVNAETVTMDKWYRALDLPVPGYPSRTRSYQYVATCIVPASTWVVPGGLSGSLNDVTLSGDSDAVAALLRGSLNGVTLAGSRTR